MSKRFRIKDKQQRDEKSKISRRVNTNLFITEISPERRIDAIKVEFRYREKKNDVSSFSPPKLDSDERRR